MELVKLRLMKKALRKYKRIYPCAKSRKFRNCFTRDGNVMYFWFVTDDKSTHLVSEKLPQSRVLNVYHW
jgi:hypothetical protein